MVMHYIAILMLSFLLTWRVRVFALHKSILDIPNDRSLHAQPTPRGGGLAIAISWFLGLIWLYAMGDVSRPLFLALLCGLPVTIIGFADDMFNLKPLQRIFVQFIAAVMALFFLGGLHFLQIGSYRVELTLLLSPIAFVAILWSVNLFNFLDGIDGYLGTEVVFIGLASSLLFNQSVTMILVTSVLGFLLWNWPKAKIFMGDVGSTLLGFNIAIIAIDNQNELRSSLTIWLILTAVFWFDATITIWRRFRNNEVLPIAHRKHAYQRLVQSGWGHRKTTLGALAVNVLGFCLAFLAYQFPHVDWIFLGFDILILYLIVRFIDRRLPFEKKKHQQRNFRKMITS